MKLVLKLRSGDIHDLDVEEIVSVDGRPFNPEAFEAQDERIGLLEGRVSSLENILAQLIATGE